MARKFGGLFEKKKKTALRKTFGADKSFGVLIICIFLCLKNQLLL